MKVFCIRKNSEEFLFGYELGEEEALVRAMIEVTLQPDSRLEISDVVMAVKACPEVFAKAA
ncbi:MAG: hypothetical protein AB7F75_03610 [Planctomycetota bacterium]